MKKIVLSIAGVMAAAAFAPEASAVPSFARQTGMACNACHQQHYPVLNGFGQAFKAAGYTMMGAQEKVEGEHLSIPNVLNASMLLKARYVKDDTAGALPGANTNTTGNGQWQIPDEFSLFFGGRVAENIGFMFEGNTASPSGLVAGFKMPIVFDLGSAKLLAVPYLTDALGVGYGFEQSSTGAVRGVRWAEHRTDISAQQFTGIGAGATTGLAFVAINDMGYINFSKWTNAVNLANPGAGAANNKLSGNYVRISATPTVGDWAMNIGAQFASGNVGAVPTPARATALDFQAQGQAAGKDLSVYATYAKNDNTVGNYFAAGRKAWSLGADYSVIPHVLHIGAAYLNGTTGAAIPAGATGTNLDSITVTAVYDLTQNVALHVNHSQRSGNSFAPLATGKQLTTFLLEAAW
ncbi:MAG: hypothetical protein M0P59_10620 [Gallionella sp.]|jgi:hypothetical protein|nr:hypothetical protein [Gallionella sp.]MCK9354600.1 hypothetical protein [Gallionella sp.]